MMGWFGNDNELQELKTKVRILECQMVDAQCNIRLDRELISKLEQYIYLKNQDDTK